jgi:hypothetical protein
MPTGVIEVGGVGQRLLPVGIRTWPSSSGNVFGSLRFSIWRDRAGDYVRRLMLDGRRKSIQPMAARLHGRTSRR